MKQCLRFSIFTNIFFVVPLAFSLYYNLLFSTLCIFMVIIFGFGYHVSNRKKYYYGDSIFAWLLIFTNLFISYKGGFSDTYFLVALFFVGVALWSYYYGQEEYSYEIFHGIWHIASAIITLLCIFTYAL